MKQFLLGMFFLTALAVLGFYTLFLTDVNLFGDQEFVEAKFPEAHGLREGDPVMVSGMRLGRVKEIRYVPEAEAGERIRVRMTLKQPLEIREGYAVFIEETTLLGGRNVNIDPGPAQATPLTQPGPLVGGISPNPMEALKDAGAVLAENRERIGHVVANLEAITTDVQAGKGPIGRLFKNEELARSLTDGVNDFAAMMKDTRALLAEVREGKGTLGQLISSDELYTNLNRIASEFATVATDLHSGKGTLGKLVYDDRLATEIDAIVANIRGISDGLAGGKGTLGMLLKDEHIAQNILRVSSALAEGQGTLGRMIQTDELYQKLVAIAEDVRGVFGAVHDKQGTLGELIMSKELYNEVLTSVRLLNRSLEDYREAAPVSTFTSVFFGAF